MLIIGNIAGRISIKMANICNKSVKAVGVIVNRDRDTELKYTLNLVESMCSAGIKVSLAADVAEEILADSLKLSGNENLLKVKNENEVLKNIQMVICLGGDGTFLKVARKAYKKGVPILGINLGNLGFLTEVEKDDMQCVVEHLSAGNYQVEERMMLDTAIIRNGEIIETDTALNDIVISRGALSRIVHLKTYINDEFVDMFPGDGLIISSPTGSTAYSLSAGGPIVDPNIDLIIVSPICPHILYSRSIITADTGKVKTVVDEDPGHKVMVTVDGQKGYEVRGGDIIEVKKSSHRTRLVRIKPKNFYNILRKKIYFRGENLKRDEVQ